MTQRDLFAASDVTRDAIGVAGGPPVLRQSLAELAADLPASWAPIVARFLSGAAGQAVAAHLQARLDAGATVFPPDPFRALRLTPRDRVRIVILGQDPYHGPGQAEGLAFSVPDGVRPPPSLRNIYKEMARDLGVAAPSGGSLVGWASRGVLLLNTVLTVEAGRPGAHQKLGWEALTDAIIGELSSDEVPKVFLLWGAPAQAWAARIGPSHAVLLANHPSPLSALRPPRPFIGCGHFSAAVSFLRSKGLDQPDPWGR